MDHIDKKLAELTMRNEPVFKDHCKHGKDCYVGSIRDIRPNKPDQWYDVYVFNQKLCIRFGNIDSEYYSPPDKWEDFLRSNFEPYVLARTVLLMKGYFMWQRR